MIKTYRFNDGAIDILYDTTNNSTAKTCPKPLWGKAKRMLTYLNEPRCIEVLKKVPNAHLERLWKEKPLIGFWSVRIDRQFRVIFKYDSKTDNCYDVFIKDYH
jgi:proteic killer suppression protein